jgi:pre-mRNA-processing factor 40
MANEWEELKNDKGETYYYNEVTGESTWDLPAGATINPTENEWVQLEDKGNPYYYNEVTGESTWDLPAGAIIKSTESDGSNLQSREVTEWLDIGNGQWQDVKNVGNIVTEKPGNWHKAKDESGVYYYEDTQEKGEYNRFTKIPDDYYVDDIILDYNGVSSISNEQMENFYTTLKEAEDLPFPLPNFTNDDELKTYDIHYKKGLYSPDYQKLFQTKITEIQTKIAKLRQTRPDVVSLKGAIQYYTELIKKIGEKKYIYFPHIEFNVNGCFLIKLDDKNYEDEEDKYSIVAYTKPTFTGELTNTTFFADEEEQNQADAYDNGNPEYKFSYRMKFESCMGECGIIQLRYLVIRNIMTEKDTNINNSDFNVDLSPHNSILIINSGKNKDGQIIKPDPEVLKYVDEFENSPEFKNSPENTPVIKFDEIIRKEKDKGEGDQKFSVIFDNNYRRNILEMLYFFSDRKNNKVEDIKEIKPNTLDMAEKIFSTINGHAMGKLKSYPTINIAEKNFITGGGNSMKKVRVFLDRLKKMYNRYIRRNNKRSKKRQPRKNKTQRKRKNGIKNFSLSLYLHNIHIY